MKKCIFALIDWDLFLKGETFMPDKLKVELKNGTVCRMGKKAFNVFLSLDEVTKFRRTDGWVDVDKDKMRDLRKNSDGRFPDRRGGF